VKWWVVVSNDDTEDYTIFLTVHVRETQTAQIQNRRQVLDIGNASIYARQQEAPSGTDMKGSPIVGYDPVPKSSDGKQ
jgi:hypothetical protein